MGEVLGFILCVVLLILYVCVVLAGLFVILQICLVALAIGVVSGIGFGIVKGVINYFSALFSSVKFQQ
ncbi:MAG: hypothetical protein ACI4MC_01450 [Candidatus Coproplasma sp.]